MQDPENRPAIYLMPVQLLVLYVVLEHAFQAGLMIGFSYMGWYVWAASSAVIIKWPFGPLVPAVVFVGVIAVGAIRPLVFDAKDAAMQGQLVSAAVVVAVALILSQYFGRLQRGDMS